MCDTLKLLYAETSITTQINISSIFDSHDPKNVHFPAYLQCYALAASPVIVKFQWTVHFMSTVHLHVVDNFADFYRLSNQGMSSGRLGKAQFFF